MVDYGLHMATRVCFVFVNLHSTQECHRTLSYTFIYFLYKDTSTPTASGRAAKSSGLPLAMVEEVLNVLVFRVLFLARSSDVVL